MIRLRETLPGGEVSVDLDTPYPQNFAIAVLLSFARNKAGA
jgi:hypothetical protein